MCVLFSTRDMFVCEIDIHKNCYAFWAYCWIFNSFFWSSLIRVRCSKTLSISIINLNSNEREKMERSTNETITSTVNAQSIRFIHTHKCTHTHTSVTNAWWSNEMVIKKPTKVAEEEKNLCYTTQITHEEFAKKKEEPKKLNPNRLATVVKICISNKLTSYECCCRFEINDCFPVKKKMNKQTNYFRRLYGVLCPYAACIKQWRNLLFRRRFPYLNSQLDQLIQARIHTHTRMVYLLWLAECLYMKRKRIMQIKRSSSQSYNGAPRFYIYLQCLDIFECTQAIKKKLKRIAITMTIFMTIDMYRAHSSMSVQLKWQRRWRRRWRWRPHWHDKRW